MKFNGTTVNRSPTKDFEAAANKVANVSKTLADSVNVNACANKIMREAIARKTEDDGRLVNRQPPQQSKFQPIEY